MGNVDTITRERYPKQSATVGASVRVGFHFDTSVLVGGTIVRQDNEVPWQTIIRLDDGRYVLATECQYTFGRVRPEERARLVHKTNRWKPYVPDDEKPPP